MGRMLSFGRSQAHTAQGALQHGLALESQAGYQRDFSLVISQLWGTQAVALFADGSALYRARTSSHASAWHATLDLPPLLPPLVTWVLAYDAQARSWLLSAWRAGRWRTVTLPQGGALLGAGATTSQADATTEDLA